MSIKKIGAVIALDGEKEYKQAISGINASMKTMKSEMKLVTERYKDSQNSLESLTEKARLLTEQYELQEEKIGVYRKALENAEEKEEKSADAVKDLTDRLKEARERMEQMRESGSATEEELKKQADTVEKLDKRLATAKTSYFNAEKSTANWQTSLNNAETDLSKINSTIQDNDKYLEEAKTSTDKTATSIDEYGKRVDGALEGQKEYKQAIEGINDSMKVTESEIKLVTEQYKDSQNSLELLTEKARLLTDQYELQEEKVGVYRQALEKAEEKEEKSANTVKDLTDKLKEARERMEQMKDSSDATEEELRKQSDTIENLDRKLEDAKTSYFNAEKSTSDWKVSLNDAETDLNRINNTIEDNDRYLDEARTSTDKTATSIDEYGNQVQDAKEKTAIFGDVLRANLVSEVIMDGIRAMADGIKDMATFSFEAGSNFEEAMSQVGATMGLTSEQIQSGNSDYKKLQDAAKAAGRTTKYTASQAAEAENYMALAGYDVQQQLETLPTMLDLAAAGNMDIADTSDMLTDSMSALGDSAGTVESFADKMAKTAQKSNTSVADLGEATLQVGGTAKMLSGGVDEMNTVLGIFADNGTHAAEGGTALRNIILDLSAPTEKAEQRMKQLGLEAFDADGNMRPLNETFGDLSDILSTMTEEDRAKVISTLFNKTDIKNVNALLANCGDRFDELSGYIKDADGAASNMADTMQNNLQGDITKLESATEGLGITVYEKFQEKFRVAVQSVTEGVSDLTEEIGSDSKIGRSLDHLADSTGDLVEKAIDFAMDAIPVVCDGLSMLIDNGDTIIGVLEGIGAGFGVFQVGSLISDAANMVKGFTTATEGAATAQDFLNTVAGNHPYILIASLAFGAIAAIGAFADANDDAVSRTQVLVEEAERLSDTMADSMEAVQESAEEFETSTQEIETQGEVAHDLADKLYDLYESGDKTAKSQEKMQQYVAQLNEVMPDLNLYIDEETGLLSQNREELYKNIDATEAYYRAKLDQERLQEIVKEQIELEKQMHEAQELVGDGISEQGDLYQELNSLQDENNTIGERAIAMLTGHSDEILTGVSQQTALKEQIADTNENLGQMQEQYNALDEEYAVVYEDMMTQQEASSQVSDAYNTQGDAAENAGNQAVTASQQMSDAAIEAQDLIEGATESILNSVESALSGFDAFSGGTEYTIGELIENLNSQLTGVENWSNDIQELADRGINQGLLQTLIDAGPSSANAVATMTQMTDEQLAEYSAGFAEKLDLAGSVTQKLSELSPTIQSYAGVVAQETQASFTTVGENIGDGMTAGMESKIDEIETVAEDMSNAAINTTLEVNDIHSPSKVYTDIGMNNGLGLIVGMNSQRQGIIAAAKGIAESAIATIRNDLSFSTFQGFGRNVTAGLASGIMAGRSEVITAITNICNTAVNNVKNTLGIHSPSTVFEGLGINTAQGFGLGYEKEMSNVNKIIRDSMEIPNVKTGNNVGRLAGDSVGITKPIDVTIPLTIDGTRLATILAQIQYSEGEYTVRNLGTV